MLQEQVDERRIAGPRGAQQGRGPLREDRVTAAILRDIAVRRAALELKIGVRTAFAQEPADVERGERIRAREHGHRAVPFDRQRADVGRHIQRRSPEEVPLVDVGASVDQVCGELEMQIEERHVERGDPVRVFEIRIGAGRNQMPRALHAALAGGIEQRSETAFVHVLGTRFGDDLAFPLADDAARVDVGAPGGEELHHLRLALRGGPHQG